MRAFIIVYMVDPAAVGTRFTMWPLHMTLLPWFDAPDAGTVEQALTRKLADMPVFEVMVGERSSFGVDKNLPVTLIKPEPQLQTLHETLLQTAEKNGWQLQGRYTGSLFKPHITQKAGQDVMGRLFVNALTIVEAQSQGYREIVGRVELAV